MKTVPMTKIAMGVAVCAALSGCAGMSDTQQRGLTGAAAGAAGGAVVGAIAGNTGMGAAIGAGAGLVGGLLVDSAKKNEEEAYRRGLARGRSGG